MNNKIFRVWLVAVLLSFMLTVLPDKPVFAQNTDLLCPVETAQKRIASSFHSSIMIDSASNVVYWGDAADISGSGNVLSPLILPQSNYSGIPVAVAGGSISASAHQLFLLTTEGLYGWGTVNGGTLPSAAFAQITLPVAAASVRFIEASGGGIAIVTTTGSVYVKNATPAANEIYGDGSSTVNNSWHQVKTDASTTLSGVTRLSYSQRGLMALTSTGKVYVWGRLVYSGNLSAADNYAYATEILSTSLPAGVSIKDVNINTHLNSSSIYASQFILGTNGKLYGIGSGVDGILGQGNTTDQNANWVVVKAAAGIDLENITTISSNNAWPLTNYGVGALCTDGKLYLWGQNSNKMLGGDASNYTYPRIPPNFDVNDAKVAYFHMGGHTTVAFLQGSNRFCYIGHLIRGSMGDGTNGTSDRSSYDCINTPNQYLCAPAPPTGCADPSANDLVASSGNATLVINGQPSVTYWGQGASSAQAGISVPNPVILYEYNGLAKGVAASATGAGAAESNQMWILTNEGIWGWGISANTIVATEPGAVGLNKLALPADITDPTDINFIRSSGGAIAVVTNAGEVFIKAGTGTGNATVANVYGDGTTAKDNIWHKVMTAPGVPLTGVVEMSFSGRAAMAVTNSGAYVWGHNTYTGSGAFAVRNFATPVILPAAITGSVKVRSVEIIQTDNNGAAQFIVASNGLVFALGGNLDGVLGNGTTTESTSWITVPGLAGVRKLTSNNPYPNGYYSIGALTLNGSAYVWGGNPNGMLGTGSASNYSPVMVSAPAIIGAGAVAGIEMGGRQTIIFPKAGGKFYFAGQSVNGSRANGVMTDQNITSFAEAGDVENCAGVVYNISGHLYYDINALTDSLVNGTGTNSAGAKTLHAYLLDEGGYVMGISPIAADGSYSFNGFPSGNYVVQIDSNAHVGLFDLFEPSGLPAFWKFTGAQLGIVPNEGINPFSPSNGALPIALKSNITNANIGINNNVAIDGKVWNDVNHNATKEIAEVYTNGGGIYANLVDPITNIVLQSVRVNDSTGAYHFDAPQGSNYKIILSATNVVPNGSTTLVTSTLPAAGNWINTGVNVGGIADTVAPNGIISVTTTNNVTGLNFGIRQYQADLSLSKEVDNATPLVGTNVVFSIIVNNAGPSTATGVKILDKLPTGYTFVSVATLNGSYVNGTGIWTLAHPIAAGSSDTIRITAMVNAAGSYTNCAQVNAANEKDTNSIPGNFDPNNPDDPGHSAEDDEDRVTPVPVPVADLKIVKSGPVTVNEGQGFSYTLRVTNAGPSNVVNALIKDAAVPNFTATSVTCNVGSGTSTCPVSSTVVALQAGTLAIPSLKKGDTITFTVSGTAGASAQVIDNIASITPPVGTVDPDTLNNRDSVHTRINASITGTVFNDVDGLNGVTPNTLNGPGTNISGTLYVHLLDSTGTVVATTPVQNDGTYRFPTVTTGNYNIVLNTSATPLATPGLPGTWLNIGEFLGNGPGTDGTANGKLAVSVTTANVAYANFGIEQPPVAVSDTAAERVNPGGTISMPVPPTTFVTSDPAPGAVTGILITAIPTNATSITINDTLYDATHPLPPGGILIPANPLTGQPVQPILLDPKDGAVVVGIEYVAVDQAGKQSPPATAYVPFTSIALSGKVFNDANGLLGTPANTVDGTGTNAGGLKAVLYHTGTNIVDAVVDVNPDGTFQFENRNAGTYSILITTATNVTIGGTRPAVTLPMGFASTGEHLGAGAGSDGAVNGILSIGTVAADVDSAKFGIQGVPEAYDIPVVYQHNPGGTTTVQVSQLAGHDPEDGPKGPGSTFVITTIPTNGTLYYNGTLVNAGDTIKNYDPALLQLDPDDGEVNVTFTYTVVDNAGIADPTPATVRMYFVPVVLRGNVLNDANGMTDNIVNGPGQGLPSGQPLYANLIDPASDTVITSVLVNADGSYAFPTVKPDANLLIQISQLPGAPGQPAPATQLPAGWVNTGEHIGTNAGHDGLADGMQMVYTGLDTIVRNINFGIERTPVADDKLLNLSSIGLDNPYPLTQKPLSGTDPEDGAYGAGSSKFIFGAQPSCCAVISYDGVELTPGTVIPNYNPALLTVTFTDIMATSISFTYQVTDEAGKLSPLATYTINTATVLPVKWQSFTVNAEGSSARLDWTTVEERYNTGFAVERSTDGRSFDQIAFVATKAPQGNSTTKLDYLTYDQQPANGINYYRLKQVDQDGIFVYSEVRELNFGAADNTISIYPNPATEKVHIKIADWTKVKEVRLLDINGREVYRSIGDAAKGIDMSNLAQSTYLLQVEQHNGVINSFKVVRK